MTDEHRDPELESVWAEWQAPPPNAEFHTRMLGTFQNEFVDAPWWRRRWVLAVAVATVGVMMAVIVLRPSRTTHYKPVQQPRFMIVSAGEHP
jgi:hypothetical protein